MKTAVALIRQPHGGALASGGAPRNKGGSGRPPSAIREAARLAFSERLHVLTDIADDDDAKAIDRIRAIDLLGKYGGVDKLALIVEEQPVVEELTKERIAELWERWQRIKSVKELEELMVAAAEKQAAAKGG